jgi:hypothetical protein
MKIKVIAASIGAAVMLVAGVGATTAAVSAPAANHAQGSRNHPAVYSANSDGSSSSQVAIHQASAA